MTYSEKSLKTLYVINILLFIAVSVGNYFYTTTSDIIVKSFTSGGFALMGLINLLFVNKNGGKNKFSSVLTMGLFVAAAADIILDFSFIFGAASFAAGHIFFFAAQCILIKFKPSDLIYSVLIFVPVGSFLFFSPSLTYFEDFMRYVAVVYAAVISLMAGKALANLVKKPCRETVLIAVGCVLFAFSDFMLALDWFASSLLADRLCMATYYPAECLLAFGVFFVVKREKLKIKE